MSTVVIPAEYNNGVIKPLKKIKENPTNIFITVTYNNISDKKNEKLSDYINSDEYKNDKGNGFVDSQEFLDELKEYKN